MHKLTINSQERVPLLKAAEVAEILNISLSMAYRLIQTGKIPHIRINQAVRVHPDDLYRYIDSNRIKVDRYSSHS